MNIDEAIVFDDHILYKKEKLHLQENKNKTMTTGSLFPHKYGGYMEILGQVDKETWKSVAGKAFKRKTYYHYLIQFSTTKTYTVAHASHIKQGTVRNIHQPLVHIDLLTKLGVVTDSFGVNHQLLPFINDTCEGKEFVSKYNYTATVMGYIGRNGYIVVFPTHGIRVISLTNLLRGAFRDLYHPSYCGVGCVGYGKWRCKQEGVHTKEYVLWGAMLRRCYSEKQQVFNRTYKDCTVDPRWHNFQNFCEDIQKLEGYAEWKTSAEQKTRTTWDLDKDIKVKDNKVYSLTTCVFIPHQQNTCECNKRVKTTGLTYIATRLVDGYVEEFSNQSEFAKKYTIKDISYAIHHAKSYQGWVFEIKEERIIE